MSRGGHFLSSTLELKLKEKLFYTILCSLKHTTVKRDVSDSPTGTSCTANTAIYQYTMSSVTGSSVELLCNPVHITSSH